MKLSSRFKKVLMMTIAATTAMSTVYAAAPAGMEEIVFTVDSTQEEVGMDDPQDQVAAVPKFFGAGTAVVTMGNDFDPLLGVVAYDGMGQEITDRIQVAGTVNTKDPGVYYLTYTVVDDNGLVGRVVRTVIVDGNIKPEREETELYGIEDIEIELFSAFDPMAGVRAYDSMDGDITRSVKVTSFVDINKPGEYLVIYTVRNSGNMEKIAYRTVTVVGELTSETTFEGIQDVTIQIGDAFDSMAGVTVMDTVDGDITASVVVTGAVDTEVAGEYLLTYAVTNSLGVETKATRMVTVEGTKDMNPVILGVVDETIFVDEKFKVGVGVSAYDAYGNQISYTVWGNFDNSVPGIREITYTAKDSEGRTATVIKTVTILERN